MLDGAVKGALQGLVTDDFGNQILVRIDIVMVPGIESASPCRDGARAVTSTRLCWT